MDACSQLASRSERPTQSLARRLQGKRVAMVTFSPYPADPRPRRAADAFLKEGATVDLVCLGDEGAPRRESVSGAERPSHPHHASPGRQAVIRLGVFQLHPSLCDYSGHAGTQTAL